MSTNEGCIYLLTIKATGTKYIGQTTQAPEKRWRQHARAAYAGCNRPLRKAIREGGGFAAEVLWSGPAESLNEMEARYIREHDTHANGLNCSGAVGTSKPRTEGNLSETSWMHLSWIFDIRHANPSATPRQIAEVLTRRGSGIWDGAKVRRVLRRGRSAGLEI